MYTWLYLSCFQLMVVYTVALPMQFLPSMMSYMPQVQPMPVLQQQLMELQAMQQLQPMPPMPMNQMQPLIIILPGLQNNVNTKSVLNKGNKEKHEDILKGDEDSVVIEAEPMEPIPTIESDQKAIIILPNGRLFINSIISAIPWLPIEINVPDAISWMYNGIVNGISNIIGSNGQQSSEQSSQETKLRYKQFKNQYSRPIMVIPL